MEPTHDDQPPRSPAGVPRSLLGLIAAGAAALLVGLIAWFVTGGDEVAAPTTPPGATAPDDTTPTTPAPEPTTTSPATVATTAPTTTTTTSPAGTAPTTTAPTTSAAPTTAPPTTVAPTTVPPLDRPTGDTWVVDSPNFSAPITLTRVARSGGAAAYDGAQSVGDVVFRCVAIVFDDGPGWQEWCGEAGASTRFVAVGGIDAWLVSTGDPGVVALENLGPAWALPTNGCRAPTVTLHSTADRDRAATIGLVCAGDQAVLRFAGTLLGPTGSDGGAVVLEEGDEGWNAVDIGTSFGCADAPETTSRCAVFGVDSDLLDAVLPIPPYVPATNDIVGVEDATDEVRGWVGDETNPDAIEAIVLDRVTEPDAELPATSQRTIVGDGLELLLVDVPLLDDSVGSAVWAMWIDADGVRRATTWATCARGVVGDLCV